MDVWSSLLNGFSVALTPMNIGLAILGCMLGMVVGILPGFGPAAALALLLPMTFNLGPVSAVLSLAAILCGSQFGGSITAILLNIPGEASSVATCIDGYKMARKGRAGAALGIAAIGSFIGAGLSLLLLTFTAPVIVRLAWAFGPVEFFSLTVLGLGLVTSLAGKSIIKGCIGAVFGLMIGVVGIDPAVGVPRFTFGLVDLLDGINFITVIMGLFGLSELLIGLEEVQMSAPITKVGSPLPTAADMRRSILPIVRGSGIGFFMGLLPGSPGAVASFASYVVEKKFSKNPSEFGEGAIEGVASPESANNALAISSMIPLFTLGIPTSASSAIMMGAFMINGIIPGPLLFQEHPGVIWGIIASMYLANVILIILNIPLVGIWIKLLQIPFKKLFPMIMAFMVIGAYSLDGKVFDIFLMIGFGIVGYIFRKIEIPLAPIALTLVLGSMMEKSFRRALMMSNGSLDIFLESRLSAALLGIALLVFIASVVKEFLAMLKRRRKAIA